VKVWLLAMLAGVVLAVLVEASPLGITAMFR
jgi:hypothetical protein